MLGLDRRAAKATWTASLVVLALYAVYQSRSTIFVLLLAVFFSYMVNPLVEALARRAPRRLGRGFVTGIVFIALAAAVGLLLSVVGPAISEQASRLGDQFVGWMKDPKVLDRLPLPEWLAPYRARIVEFVQKNVGSGGASIMPAARQIGLGLLRLVNVAVALVVVPILAFQLIKDAPAISGRFDAWARRQQRAAMWSGLWNDLDRLLGRYMRALVILALATTVSYMLVFTIAGVPFSLVLPLGAGLLEFVPVAGPLVAAVLTLAVAGLSGYDHLLAIAAFIAGYRLLQDYVLTPWLMSGSAALPSPLVLLALLGGAELGGVAGAFVAVPVMAAARVLVLRVAEASKDPMTAGARELVATDSDDETG